MVYSQFGPMQTDTASPVPAFDGDKPRFNPWLFVPLLYFMQAIPVTVVQEVSSIFFKDLGIPNEPITRWTSLISLPWSLQLLLGPLVDLNGTKRRWILGGQFLITFGLIATAFVLRLPNAFEVSLVILFATAVTSALCNIATDGFYLLSMAKDQQAKFVGIQTTCYRLGRLFCSGILVLIAGLLMNVPRVNVQAPENSYLQFSTKDTTFYATQAKLGVMNSRGGALTNDKGDPLQPEIKVPNGTMQVEIAPDGTVTALVNGQRQVAGQLQLATFPAGSAPVEREGKLVSDAKPMLAPGTLQVSHDGSKTAATLPVDVAWFAVLLFTAVIYGLGHFVNRRSVPKPVDDVPREQTEPNETARNIGRTFVLLALGVGGYFFINAIVRLVAHALSADRPGWRLPDVNKVAGFELPLSPVGVEVAQLIVCGAIVLTAIVLARRLIARTPMGEALGSYVMQPGFIAIFFFILFYRFGEVMVSRISPLFLKDTVANGGLAIPNEQLGLLKGLVGVLGIIAGGLLGGLFVSKYGLRKAFWPLALAMHVPNLLYLWASTQTLPMTYVPLPWIGQLNITLGAIDFVDQFGYGFGFAGYFVYLMWVAQRGNFRTTHYAIGTGMGALCIAIAGIVSGILQKNFGYQGFFISVLFLSIPGMLAILFIPLDESHKKIKAEVE